MKANEGWKIQVKNIAYLKTGRDDYKFSFKKRIGKNRLMIFYGKLSVYFMLISSTDKIQPKKFQWVFQFEPLNQFSQLSESFFSLKIKSCKIGSAVGAGEFREVLTLIFLIENVQKRRVFASSLKDREHLIREQRIFGDIYDVSNSVPSPGIKNHI